MNDSILINIYTKIQRNHTKFLANKIGGEMVMMNMETGDFITLNNVGTEIWNLTELPITVKELIGKLLTVYDLTEEKCINETIPFLQNSLSENIFIFHNDIIG